jgi:DNA-binding transcriptional MerR regulator
MAFYRIKEAAEKIGVVPHVLRFWESQFPSLKPSKTSRGQRLYNEEDLENFLRIKHLLYNEGYSIPGARKVLNELKGKGAGTDATVESNVDGALKDEMCRELLGELQELRDWVKEF